MKGWEIALVALLALALLVPSGALASTRQGGPEVTVVIQFGNGAVMSANVVLPPNNITALKATELACENLSIGFHYTWYSGLGGLVDRIGWESNTWPGAYWHLYIMENNSAGWVLSSKGASQINMSTGDAIAWVYTEDNANYVPLENISAPPGHYQASYMYRGNENSTAYYSSVLNVSSPVWSFRGKSQYGGFYSTPAVAHGMIFAADDSAIYAIGPGGVEVWNNSLGATYQSSPAVFEDMVYIGTKDGYIRAFHVENGTLAWEKKISENSIASSPKVDVVSGRRVVFIGTYESSAPWGKMYAFDAFTGEEMWNVSLDGGVYFGSFALSSGKIVVPLSGHYNSSTWSFEPPYGIACINETDGKILWNITSSEAAKYSPMIVDSTIYTPMGSSLVAMNFSGGVVWNITLNGTASAPAYHHGIYVGTTTGHIYSLSTNGTVIWESTVGGAIQSGVIATDNSVVVTTNQQNASVYILNAENGSMVREFSGTNFSWLLAAPVIYDSMLVVASGTDMVIAIGALGSVVSNVTTGDAYLGKSIEVAVRGEGAYQAFLYYRNSSSEIFHAVRMSYDSGTGEYVGYIPPQNSPTTVQYYVVIYNDDGTTSQSEVKEVQVSEPVPEFSVLIVPVIALALLALTGRKI